MRRSLIILVTTVLGISQINWEIEIVDSASSAYYDFWFNSLALDTDEIPHVVYNKYDFEKIIYASRVDAGWQREIVDSAFHLCYGFSLIFDNNNTPHFSYACKYDSLGKTYICHTYRHSDSWITDSVDSIDGDLGNYYWNFNTSIDLDTSGLPGIAYIAWNVEDSIHYIKYAHFNGINWDTSVVEYDSVYANIQTSPTDWSPSLRFDGKNTPHIAFYHVYALYHSDTLKIAHYDITLSRWIVNPVLCNIHAGIPVSLALNSQDYPYIAHSVDAGLYCTWWDGLFWRSEYTGEDIGWLSIRIVLDLDNSDNPHIAYNADPLAMRVRYCFKDTIWYLCGCIDPDSSAATWHPSLDFDEINNQPHVSYGYGVFSGIGLLKYAKGNFVGVEETRKKVLAEKHEIQIYPNPTCDEIYIILPHQDMTLEIFDIAGHKIWDDVTEGCNSTWDCRDKQGHKLPAGIYFVRLGIADHKEIKKIVLLR